MTGKGSGADAKKKRGGLPIEISPPRPHGDEDSCAEKGSLLSLKKEDHDCNNGNVEEDHWDSQEKHDKSLPICPLGLRIDLKLKEMGMTIEQLHKDTNIPRRSLDNYRTGQTEPRSSRLRLIGNALKVSLDWLVPEEPDQPLHASHVPSFVNHSGGIPLTSLAGCGFRGWFMEDALQVRTHIPQEIAIPKEELKAVLAIGESMLPESIPPGAICYCHRTQSPIPNKPVFLRTSDGRASIKLFLRGSPSAKSVFLRGWLPLKDGETSQTPYHEEVPRSLIQEIMPVIFTRTML